MTATVKNPPEVQAAIDAAVDFEAQAWMRLLERERESHDKTFKTMHRICEEWRKRAERAEARL